MMPSLLMLLSLPLLLVCSAFFSGSETALFSLSKLDQARLARGQGFVARMLTTLLSETRGLLITLLLGNMTVNVLFFVVSSVLLIQAGRAQWVGPVGLAVLSVAPLLAIILLGEVLPKLVAARLTLSWARLIALPMYVFHRSIGPIRWGAQQGVIAPLARLIAPPERPAELSAEEMASLLKLSQRHGVIDPEEQRLLQQVLSLNQLKVRDLMVPRVDIVAFELGRDPAELLEMFRQKRLRHIPVYEGDLDHIRGLTVARQVLLERPETAEAMAKLIRSVKFVPEVQRADQLLLELRRTGTNFAIVVDEYGGTAGLITLEDVVEKMVGDIPGEYEPAGEPSVEPAGAGRWVVDADLPVHEWVAVFGRHPAVESLSELGVVATVGGLVMARLGRIPSEGESVRIGSVRLTVRRMRGSRVEKVEVALVGEEAESEPGG